MKLFLAFFLIFSMHAMANDAYRRVVNFEWEPIEGAKFYEIEIRKRTSTNNAKASSFKTENAEWTGKLQTGRYEFRLRALDKRKVPGDWSGYAELDVLLETVKPKFPASDAQVKSEKLDEQSVKFEWAATPGSEGYTVEVFNDKNEVIKTEKVTKPQFEVKLPVAQNYSWKVKAISKDGLESEAAEPNKFTLVGPKLEKVKLEKPENEFVREVKWAAVEKAEAYDVTIAKFNPITKKWQKFKEFESYNQTSMNFEPEWSGGQYRFIVKARANVRENSEVSAITFPVREGNRGPAAEYVQTMRKSIDRVDGWFSHASWYASSISLSSQYRGTLGVSTSAITGTGRLGVGLLRSESPWGFMAIMDAGGYIFENKPYNFFGVELSAIKRTNTSDRGELRYSGGLYGKEFPAIWFTGADTIANQITPAETPRKYSKGAVVGPHGGVEYWYSLTPKFGLQANAHLYIPMTAMSLPNGGKLEGMEMNYSVGVLGSYRYSQKLTGLMGVNYRKEAYTYTDNSDPSIWSSGTLIRSTNKVKTSIDGVYLNFMAEYSF